MASSDPNGFPASSFGLDRCGPWGPPACFLNFSFWCFSFCFGRFSSLSFFLVFFPTKAMVGVAGVVGEDTSSSPPPAATTVAISEDEDSTKSGRRIWSAEEGKGVRAASGSASLLLPSSLDIDAEGGKAWERGRGPVEGNASGSLPLGRTEGEYPTMAAPLSRSVSHDVPSSSTSSWRDSAVSSRFKAHFSP